MRDLRINGMNVKGQAIVELALVLFLLLLLVMGIFEFGRAMYIKNTLVHAARAGARAAVVTPNIISESGVTCGGGAPANAVIYQTVCSNLSQGIQPVDVTIDVSFAEINGISGLNPGDMVAVKVTLNNYHSKYRVVPFIPVPDYLPGETAMRYE
jgi:Flp pilus assembly protein TadG